MPGAGVLIAQPGTAGSSVQTMPAGKVSVTVDVGRRASRPSLLTTMVKLIGSPALMMSSHRSPYFSTKRSAQLTMMSAPLLLFSVLFGNSLLAETLA